MQAARSSRGSQASAVAGPRGSGRLWPSRRSRTRHRAPRLEGEPSFGEVSGRCFPSRAAWRVILPQRPVACARYLTPIEVKPGQVRADSLVACICGSPLCRSVRWARVGLSRVINCPRRVDGSSPRNCVAAHRLDLVVRAPEGAQVVGDGVARIGRPDLRHDPIAAVDLVRFHNDRVPGTNLL